MSINFQDRRDRQKAHEHALETFDYEIAKNEKEVRRLREIANIHYAAGSRAEASDCQRQIKDADQRIATLKRQRFEVDERERDYRFSEASDDECDLEFAD